jgi:selenocysteine lyase/cysteine desulfurase
METRDRVCARTGLAPLASPEFSNGLQMAAAPLPGNVDLPALKTSLYDEYCIEVPLIAWNRLKLIRISVQGYNSHGDVDKLILALRLLLKS